jgi:hypothetical protein
LTREGTLTARYQRVKAYATRLETSLPNAREVGLAAYDVVRTNFDRKFGRCVRVMRKIENDMTELFT